ncbi:nuclear transport factor 2 family protein [Pseudonocardia endophytica]|uniref:Ketosteroid isomerase-like protein n=1 Tax=Pseudonocardia endophytica TaxID=401976 RepID=A0A4R1HJZ4_PSEEN|nr:nuclear transport factor 2 family protein [Pseudonocardia endophytica]TCK20825.1 ketosteroid isomerase-like protein [Pseudonocardia endophytica]
MEANVIARRLYAAAASDPSALLDLLAPDVVLHDPGSHPNGGAHRGRDAVLAFLGASSSAGASMEVLDVMGGSHHAAAYVRVRADRGDARLDNLTVHLMRIEDGRVAEFWFHNRDQAHVDAFWSAVLPAGAGAA